MNDQLKKLHDFIDSSVRDMISFGNTADRSSSC